MFNQESLAHKATPSLDKMVYVEMAHSEPHFNRNYFMKVEEVNHFRKKYLNTGLYRSAYMYDNKDDVYESCLFSDLYFDFDSEEDVELAREDILFVIWKMHLANGFGLPMEAFRIYFSGKKGFHLVIPSQYIGVKPNYELDRLFKWIALDMFDQSINETVDLVVYEKRRLWRMVNSKHQDTGLHKIPLNYDELRTKSLDEIAEMAKSPRFLQYPEPKLIPQARKEYVRYAIEMLEEDKRNQERWKNRPPRKPFEEGEMPSYVKDLIDNGPVKGIRNESAAALTSYWLQQGYSEDEIFEQLLDWNAGSIQENELKKTMKSILKRGLTYGKKRLRALAEGDLAPREPERERKGELPPWKTEKK